MRLGLFFVAAVIAAAQSDSATSLLEKVQTKARNIATWRAAGEFQSQEAARDESVHSGFHYSFNVVFQHPDLARFEITRPEVVLSVCDGSTGWTYMPAMKQYTRAASDMAPACTRIPRPAEYLLDGLQSAREQGLQAVTLDGNVIKCQIVVGTYDHIDDRAWSPIAPQQRSGPLTRTMCIDPDRLSLIWDRIQHDTGGKPHLDAISYTSERAEGAEHSLAYSRHRIYTTVKSDSSPKS